MNLLNVLAAPNPTTILLLGGAALLLLNIVYGIVRATRGNLKAGWFTVLLAIVACAMIAIGTVQTVNASRPNPAAFGGRTGGGTGAGGAGTGGFNSGSAGTGGTGTGTGTGGGRSGNAGTGGNNAGAAAPSGAATADASQPNSVSQANTGSLVSDPTVGSNSPAAQVATQDAPVAMQQANGGAPANGTPAANGTPGRRGFGGRRTPGPGTPAAGGAGGGNFNGGGNGTAAANGASGAGFAGQSGNGGTGNGSGTGTGGAGSTAGTGNGAGTGNTTGAGGAAGSTGTTGGTRTGNQAGGVGGSQVPAAITEAQLDQAGMSVALLGGAIGIVLGLILYFMERRRPGFISANSRGLLNLGAGIFVVVAILVIPLIPGQASQATVAAAAGRAIAARVRAVPSATPSGTPLPTATATALPSLTPTIADTAMAMATQIPYTSTYTVNLQKTLCTATANTVLSLRPDPSTAHQAIGRVIGGALLQVVGQNADGKWLNVINNDNNTSVQGWVSASFITQNPSCTGQPLPIVDDAGKTLATAGAAAAQPATATPGAAGSTSAGAATLTLTPTMVATKAAAATNTIAPTATSAVTAAACTVFTTSTVYLRADPSITHAPLAQIPDRTALTPLGKLSNGQWWQVTYGDQTGWVGAAAVLASSSCTNAPLLTLTPTP